MKIIDSGHEYLLESLDGGEPVRLTFVKREGEGFPFNSGHHPGTNVQEVLRALIERGDYLNRQVPCAETESATAMMRGALLLFELRAARRHGRNLDLNSTQEACCLPTCKTCGHIGCEGHK